MKVDIPCAIRELLKGNDVFCLAIDGRCGAGKTTLAEAISAEYECSVVHLDDFFLPKGKKKEGFGNLEKDRILEEILIPISEGKSANYRIFSCAKQSYTDYVTIPQGRSLVIEGSYALLPEFRFAYTHSIFLSVSKEEQEKRIRYRNGDAIWKMYASRWIPEEEAYFTSLRPETAADLRILYAKEV